MAEPGHLDDLLEHLTRTTGLEPRAAQRLVAEVVAYFAESAAAFAVRRHAELRAHGLANPDIYARIAAELAERRFAAAPASERQIRRWIYG
ncbi:MAG: hypothetical protein QNK03_15230 [Myxococcota bacterium]|nr:hypothetical protein [Myxococcota bacterium]